MDDKDKTALSRTYVLKPGALNETKSLEELAELAEGADEPEAPEAAIDPPPKLDHSSELSTRPRKPNGR